MSKSLPKSQWELKETKKPTQKIRVNMITQHMVIRSTLITRVIEYSLNQTMTKQ